MLDVTEEKCFIYLSLILTQFEEKALLMLPGKEVSCPARAETEAVGGCLLRELARKGSFLKRDLGAGDISSCRFNFLCVNDGSLPFRDNTRMLDMHFAVVTEC